jgi:UDP-N-acetyl-D-mannosaminuronic acid dehydrogenase
MEIAVIGLGSAGLPIAAHIADKGFNVTGVDLDKDKCEKINNGKNLVPEEPELGALIKKHAGKNLKATTSYEKVKDCELYIVIVPLLIDKNHNADFKYLKNAFRNIGKILNKGDCVVLETTVPPGTTENLAKKWLETESRLKTDDYYLAYSPERIMTGFSISRLRVFPKVIGGINDKSGKHAFNIYKKFIPNLSLVSNSRVAEFIKIVEGCYRFTNIALANELFKIAEELNIDFNEAREFAKHEFCNVHMPSTGVGGHCIPVYPWFLIKEMEKMGKKNKSQLLYGSHLINDSMVEYWCDKIVDTCMRLKKPLNEIKICVKGITFRDNVKNLSHSRNLALVRLLTESGLDVYVYDKMFSKEELKNIGLNYLPPDDADVVFDPFKLVISA